MLAVTAHGERRRGRPGAAYDGVGDDQTSTAPTTAPTSPCGVVEPVETQEPDDLPNVLATRYAGADLAAIWSPEHKIVLERQLWIAVLKAQRDLGVDVPDGVVEAYEEVVDQVDLDSIAARERVTRHDVKARIEEFCALAGHEHIHKGMTSRDLTENVEQLQVRQSPRAAPRPRRRRRWPGWPGWRPSTRRPVMAGRSHNVAAQATTLGKRFATVADELLVALERLEELLARYPLRGIKGPVGTAQDMLDLLDGDAEQAGRAGGSASPRTSGSTGCSPASARSTRAPSTSTCVSALVQLVAGAVQPRHHDPADGRQRAGHRGLPGGPGRVVARCRTR